MKIRPLHPNPRLGFTLLEILVAMVILTVAMSIAYSAFSGTIRGWKRGIEVIDGIKHGDFAMTQLVAALNRTISDEEAHAAWQEGRQKVSLSSWLFSGSSIQQLHIHQHHDCLDVPHRTFPQRTHTVSLPNVDVRPGGGWGNHICTSTVWERNLITISKRHHVGP